MQNRFKFRHFNLLTKKMTYYDKPEMQVCLSDDFKSGLIFPLSEEYDDNAMYMGNYTYYQQCTGLKDKNGKLIFEGDIVKIEYYDYVTKYRIGTVEWEDDGYGITYFKAKDTKVNGCSLTDFVNDKKEVIGNIYENPELLEVKGE